MRNLLLVLMFGTVSMVACAHEPGATQDNISVVGVGEIEAEPDRAVLNVSIHALQPDLAAAKTLADQRYADVLEVILASGIDKKSVKATQISAQPEYEYRSGKRIYKGERVSRSLAIIIDDLQKVSSLLQALVDNRVSTIDGISTGFKDPKKLQREALAAAADDASDKAKFLAERLGRSLGSAYQISEGNNGAPPVYRREAAMAKTMTADAAPPEMFGTQKIRATVSVSFNLL
ncbi:MAG: SIMPL domain-containing protein [Arenicella sp.]|nr:SIMPL domain-containing protein [Arenicella sp.]